MSKFTVRIEYENGHIKEVTSVTRPRKVSIGVLKIGESFFNLATVDRYSVNGKLPLW